MSETGDSQDLNCQSEINALDVRAVSIDGFFSFQLKNRHPMSA